MRATDNLQTLIQWVTHPETAPEMLADTVSGVQAIGVEGSVNNPDVAGDEWTDLDVTLFVTQPINSWDWVTAFGEPIIWQHFQNHDLFGHSSAPWDTWLVRYDGPMRIDWKFAPASDIAVYLAADSLNTLVWSRHQVDPARPTSAASHAVTLPTQDDFETTLNELLWCAGNAAKGLHRQNLVYANEMINRYVRPELLNLCAWQIAYQHPGFDAGIASKSVAAALPVQQREQLMTTYQQGALEATTTSLRVLLKLTDAVVNFIAKTGQLKLPEYYDAALRQLNGWL